MSSTTYSPLLTDLYQLTMAYGYWQLGMHQQNATFHLSYRSNPFNGQFAINCGLASAIEFLQNFKFAQEDVDYLATLDNPAGKPLFANAFLDYLSTLSFSCDIDAIPEGQAVFPQVPLLRIEGPLLQCQLLETPLLNIINFQTLIATKSARICHAAQGDTVIEFGLRRAQGPNGGLSASRAAYVGGCHATSNTLAGKLYDIPVKGTHAHSWVTAFDSEKDAFTAYAKTMPDNGVYLVDTYDTVQGVKNAIETGKLLREQGSDLLGIRLDSGDMLDLSIKTRKMLDEAGFEQTAILASNMLDEVRIQHLKQQGAKINSWGVGTHLATAYDQPALDGVYKLSSLTDTQGQRQYRLKLSEQADKISTPGRLQTRRFFINNTFAHDIVYDLDTGIGETPECVLFHKNMPCINLEDYDGFVDLLVPVFRQGKLEYNLPNIHNARQRAISDTNCLYNKLTDSVYPVGLEKKLHELKQKLIQHY